MPYSPSASSPPHPGQLLRKDYLEPYELTITQLAQALRVSRKNLSEILNGHTGISPEMALRLSRAFNTDPEWWMNQQMQYDLWQAQQKNAVQEVQPLYQTKQKE